MGRRRIGYCKWDSGKKCCDVAKYGRRRTAGYRRRCGNGFECENPVGYIPPEGCDCTPEDQDNYNTVGKCSHRRRFIPFIGHGKLMLYQEQVNAEKADEEKADAERASAMMEMKTAENHPHAEKSLAEQKSEDEDEDGVDDEDIKADDKE